MAMNSSSATPISLTVDSCAAQSDNRCRIATPAPSTPFPYGSLSPYGPISAYPFMSRYSTAAAAAHMQSPYASPLANSLAAAGLAYPHDMFHYNPYSALTPTSPLTPSSFWSLTAQQSYHQMNGIAFGPSGPIAYNTNAHLFNMFSPNSLSPMSPSPDLHSPSLYPRVSSLPLPYASSPGLSSAFLSPSSMPLLLSPSLSSSVDRPPTYLSDNTSTPSTTPSMTPSIKCEPTDMNCGSHQTSQSTVNHNFHKTSVDNHNYESERVDSFNSNNNDRSVDRPHHKTHHKHNEHNSSKHSSRHESKHHKTITTTITTASTVTISKEKHSARVEPLIRSDETIGQVIHNNNTDVHRNTNGIISDKTNDMNTRETLTTTVEAIDGRDCLDNEDINNINNKTTKTTSKVKRELNVCDMSLPLNSVKSVPNVTVVGNQPNAKDIIENNTNNPMKEKSLKIYHKTNDSQEFNHKNLVIDCNSNSNSNSSDGNEVSIINSDHSLSDICIIKKSKDAKRESQLKQLQSYRKESHRHNVNHNKTVYNESSAGHHQSNAAISIVLPKPKSQVNGEQEKSLIQKSPIDLDKTPAVNKCLPQICDTNKTSQSKLNPMTAKISTVNAIQSDATHPKTQTVIPCHRPKSVPKVTTNLNNLSVNQSQQIQKQSNNNRKAITSLVNENSIQLTANVNKLAQNSANSTAKQLPKKPRISRKPTSATIPIGIAIAQQRTSPKTKSPTDSATNASQLKPILPTLSLPVMSNSPILITDSPPAGTSLWIKPTPNSGLSNPNSIQNNSQFSLTGDYHLARDSITGHLFLIRNSSSLPTTPTTTPKPLIPPIKGGQHSAKSSPSAIITVPMGTTPPQQFFANLGQSQASALILDTSNTTPLVQIAATTPVTKVMSNLNANESTTLSNTRVQSKDSVKQSAIGSAGHNSMANVERGCQASISDDELSCDNMKTTATQVDMDYIHSSEEDDDNEGKRHKLVLFGNRKQRTAKTGSLVDDDEDESSDDSMQLQIVDELGADEPPQLTVKSGAVMQFIDHHGLDLLVDSIEEFAAREETTTPTTSSELSMANGLQLLSTLAEQRSREERLSGADGSPLRRHSTDSSITMNGTNNDSQTNPGICVVKKRQRSESCFTTNAHNIDESNDTFNDFKKLMRTSGCQTDSRLKPITDRNSNLRRSERIFINDSVVSNVNGIDVNVDDLVVPKELKRKDMIENTLKSTHNISNNMNNNNSKVINEKSLLPNVMSIKMNDKMKSHHMFKDIRLSGLQSNQNQLSFIDNKTKSNDKMVFCDNYNINNESIVCDLNAMSKESKSEQKVKKIKKKKLLPFNTGSNGSDLKSFCMTGGMTDEKKMKKRKKKLLSVLKPKKKLKTDSDKQIDDSIESIIKKVTQTNDNELTGNKSVIRVNKPIVDNKKLSTDGLNGRQESKTNNESKDDSKKKRPIVKPPIDLYDEKRMKLLDETIDEIIAKELVPSDSMELMDEFIDNKDLISCEAIDEKPKCIETMTISTAMSTETTVPSNPIEESPKPKPLVKQASICSTLSSTSSSSSSLSSDSCLLTKRALNLKLSESDLDLKLNVIMLVDGLLFVGEICPIQAPDIYGIVLHGERQHRPIIYSQEEMLNEAIREVKPSLDDIYEGQRVCAYWSTQYRHLYPGYVRSSSPHPNLVFVEFDDGDNGRIAVDDIRLLPQDYPQMKTSADPLKNLERKRRMSSSGKDSRHSKSISDNSNDDKRSLNGDIVNRSIMSKNNEEFMNNKDLNSNQRNSSTNTSNDTNKDELSAKSDVKKKKKKHNKDDRHHRHHHNHKHHHCRNHHKKCKKHKKWREGRDGSDQNSGQNSEQNSTKGFKLLSLKTNRHLKGLHKKDTDAQTGLVNNSVNKNDDKDKSQMKTFVKKTPKQRALDRLRTNLSEKMCTIMSPIRKRINPNATNTTNNTTPVTSPTPKKRERIPSAEKSKIAAFLPDRQLWHWSGKCVKRTGTKGSRNRKMYYNEIERGREHIRVDDCAVFLSTGRPHLPYIGRIDTMWQTGSGTMIVKVRWFYHPEETKGQPQPLQDKIGALFESSHFDVNDVQTISHKCQVISWTEYQDKRNENALLLASDDPPNVYYLAGKYDALGGRVEMDATVPVKQLNKLKED